ncbi:response regulator [Winogradskyella undariae]|uniref:chemotaxis protein CheB n=1 Tax=Winogradskyella undariae TaxID=1285465 RepID=UPI00156B7F61|nr:chemotaxis protein CheB [Winogradskyella undariae]NRR89958.1 response regulator [Winogradskyella undariae]
MKKNDPKFYVVGIGASAGGLDAIQNLFDHLPSDTGMAFIIIQHLSPDFKSLMPELLSKHTKMPIYTAEDKQTIKPNCIYLNQRSKNLHVKGSELYLLDKGPKHNLNLPIDIFFHTLGEEYKERSIGVILSGTGSDGSRGIKTIKEGGGTIIVQDPSTAQFDGMPNSAISTNTVDYILSPPKIAEILHKNPISRPLLQEDFNKHPSNETLINDILTIVYKYSGVDFREYKKNTLLRRIEKRMNINNIDHVFDYATYLSSNVSEQQSLKEDFLIGVTRFFRDTEAFERLKNTVIPEICKNRNSESTIRVWIAGCSTGEEVYSLAILIDNYLRTHQLNLDFKIFATDIDPRALVIAGVGVYHVNIINEIEKPYLDQYFIKNGDRIQIIKRIREKIVFSNHNLIKDPPFIRMDLISCRNLLIYFDTNIQKKVMFNFQFALNQFSYLFLGNSESLGEVAKLFKTIDVKWKIFQNISPPKQIPSHSSNLDRITTLAYKYPETPRSTPVLNIKESPELVFHKYLSQKFSPDSIFIDHDFNILFINGDAGKRLSHSSGIFQNNLLKMVNPDIAVIIRSGIRRAEATKHDVIIEGVINETLGKSYSFDLKFHKAQDYDNLNNCYLIEFTNDIPLANATPLVLGNIDLDEVSNQRLEDLETALKIAKTELQNAIEELETSNEELQSSNEELMASNEELQSTNEELQSVNEELYTVNTEMQEKNKELTNLNNDITNLLDNTEIATLFLDTDLRIRKFTPALKEVFNLDEVDLGRTLSSFTSNFKEDTRNSIIQDSKFVLDKLKIVEKQVKDQDDNHYLLRISPFITSNKIINGVVITLNNINKLIETELELLDTGVKYHKLFENLNEGFMHAKIITNKDGEPVDWEYIDVNPAFEEILNLTTDEIIGKRILEIIPGIEHDPNDWISKYGKTALSGENQTFETYIANSKKHYFINIFSPKKGEFAGTIADFTELKNKEEALSKSEKELNRVQELTHVGGWYLDIKTDKVTWTGQLFKIYGLDPNSQPPDYKEQENLFTKESWAKLSKAIEKTKKYGTPYELELNLYRSDGNKIWIKAQGEIVEDKDGNKIALRGAAQDVTSQKLSEVELINAKKIAEEANLHKNYFLANMSHEIRTPMNGVLGFSELLKNDSLTKEERFKYLEIIDGNSKQLLNLIDDIIDIAKIESNELKVSFKECDISSLISNLEITYNQLKIAKHKKDIVFKTHIPVKPLYIITDEHRLQQVVSNLLNNALKFSEKGEISFGFNVNDNTIKFFVQDNGMGIKKSKQIEIFERFKQLNYESNAKYGGTGLGLTICKGILTLLGGDITVSSEENKGTLFEFTIPIKYAKEDLVRKKVALPKRKDFLKNKTILIAEDDSLIRLLFKIVLKDTGANVLFAKTGVEAVEIYSNTEAIDIVLLDIRMPAMNGIEAMGEILKINPMAKIIMQTAYSMPDEKERCYKKGCLGFLSKPIIKDELYSTLNKWVNVKE